MFKKLTMALALLVAMALAACGGGPGGPGGPAAGGDDGGAAVPAADDALTEELSVFNRADYNDEELLVQYE